MYVLYCEIPVYMHAPILIVQISLAEVDYGGLTFPSRVERPE